MRSKLPSLTLALTATLLLLGEAATAASVTLDLRSGAAADAQARTPAQRLRSAGVLPAAPDADGIVRATSLAVGASRAASLAVGDLLSLQLFDDVETRLVLRERTQSPLGGASFLASAEGDAQLTAVVLQAADGAISIEVTDLAHRRVYHVASGPDGVTVRETDPSAGVRSPAPPLEPTQAPTDVSRPRRAMAMLQSDQSSNLMDILVVFDRAAQTWADRNGGGITNFATLAVQKANVALGNTGLSSSFRFRLVGVLAVAADGGTSVDDAVTAARNGTGVWKAVPGERDRVGADIVTVLIDTGTAYGSTGIGYSLMPGATVAGFSENAYNACAVRSVAQSHTMTHEIGHHLGAGHATAQIDSPGPQYYDYAAGYYFTANDTAYHTIMAYDDDGKGNSYFEVPYFSSPDFTYEGVAVGDAKHDNTRTIAGTYTEATQWRKQVVPMSYDVYFSPEGGLIFTDSITVALTPGKAGLPIRYTLDGSTPTTTSTLYSAPITLTQTTTIRAVTVTDGVAGPVFEATYSLRDLGAGLDAPHLPWRTSEEYPWTFQTTNTYDGVDAVQSTDGGEFWNQPSWLETTVTGPTVMSFRYRTHYYSGHAAFSVGIDSTTEFSDVQSTGDEWRLAEVSIPSGSHTVRFTSELKGGRTSGFNGAWLDQVRFDALSRPPTISPATTKDVDAACVFTNVLTVTLTPPDGRVGQLYYTTDGSDPSGKDAHAYDGPFVLTQSTHVRAIFVEGGKDASVEVGGYYLERHPVRPGEWTTDVDGVRAAAAEDGSLICVMLASYKTCGWCQAFDPVANDPAFLDWAAASGVYLVAADTSLYFDAGAAYDWFWDLNGSEAVPTPKLCFVRPDQPDTCIASGVGRDYYDKYSIGSVVYDGTVKALIEGVASVLGKTPPAAPTTASSGCVASFPVQVTLANPDGSGTLYYTLDGTTPTKDAGTVYSGPISVSKSGTTLKAVIWTSAGGYSSVFVRTFRTFADVLGTSGVTWSTSGDATWEADETAERTMGAPFFAGQKYSSTLSGVVPGRGKLVFTLGGSSNSGSNTIKVFLNGTQKYSYGYNSTDGTSKTVTLEYEVSSDAGATFAWTYNVGNPDYHFKGNGAWLSDVHWYPVVTEGGQTTFSLPSLSSPLTVSNDWLIAKGLLTKGQTADIAQAQLLAIGANGLPRYASYLYGLEPDAATPAEDQLKATIQGFDAEGVPIVGCTPEPNDKSRVRVTKLGKAALGDANWTEVTEANKADVKFFKVKYEILP